MVSNEEIKRMLEDRRRGVNIKREKTESENYKICPHCKTKNPEKALFCVHCGKKLDKNLEVKCPSCSTENPVDAKFCVGCGETLKNESTEKVSEDIGIESDKTGSDSGKTIQEVGSETGKAVQTEPPESEERESEKPEVAEKAMPRTGVPSAVPEHGIINKKGLKKICPSCKGKNLKNAKFCVVCGEKFEEKPAETVGEEKPAVTVGENENEKPSLMERVNAIDKPDTETPKEAPAEIKVPQSIIELKNQPKEEKLEEEKSIDDTVVPAETEIKEPEKAENIDPIEKIKKAKELLDIGAITSEEFENIKKKYLEKI